MHRVRLVIADRRPIVLQGFVSLFGAQPDFEVVACCLDGASCLAAIRRLAPDVVLLEDGFTDVTASDMLAVVDDEGLSSRLVFFTASVSSGDLATAIATGACGAISMCAKPEALVQSLRLEKPGSDLARVGNGANGIGSFGNNVLALLTVNERTIMDRVADGLSNSEIARALGVSPGIVRMHLDHARRKLGICSRTELVALALSRRYGAISTLAAVILAALDDSANADHAAIESFTVMAANGSAEVVTIKISRKEKVSGGTPARAASKDQGGAGAATGASTPTGKRVDPGVEIAASSFAQAALNVPRPSSSNYNTLMMAAFVALIYELDGAAHAAQAFDFGDVLADVFTSSTASDAKGLAAVAAPSFANFDGTPATAVYDGAFAFEFAQGDTITRDHSELHVGDADAEENGSDRANTIPQGSGTINVVAAAANEGTRDTTQAGQDNEPNHDQGQPALHDSDNGSEAAKGHIKHEVPGDDLDTNKPQHDLQTASVKSADEAHSALKVKAEGKEGASSDDAGRAKSTVYTELGDSFHFKNGANTASSDSLDLQQLGHESGKAHEDGQHAAAHNGPVLVQDADAIDTSAAQHDHLGHSNHYAAHDLIV